MRADSDEHDNDARFAVRHFRSGEALRAGEANDEETKVTSRAAVVSVPSDAAGSRRRGQLLVDAILDATITELGATGYAALTMEAVAARAQTGKAALYRRWSGKADLVADALEHALPMREGPPEYGDLRADMLAALRVMVAFMASAPGCAIRRVSVETAMRQSDDASCREFVELKARAANRRKALILALLQRAADRGEVRQQAVCGRVAEVGPALVVHRYLLDGAISDSELVAIVDEIMLPLLRA